MTATALFLVALDQRPCRSIDRPDGSQLPPPARRADASGFNPGILPATGGQDIRYLHGRRLQ